MSFFVYTTAFSSKYAFTPSTRPLLMVAWCFGLKLMLHNGLFIERCDSSGTLPTARRTDGRCREDTCERKRKLQKTSRIICRLKRYESSNGPPCYLCVMVLAIILSCFWSFREREGASCWIKSSPNCLIMLIICALSSSVEKSVS